MKKILHQEFEDAKFKVLISLEEALNQIGLNLDTDLRLITVLNLESDIYNALKKKGFKVIEEDSA